MQQCTDDSNYTGEYARGKRHGAGVYSFPNGDAYSGQYEHDLPQVGGGKRGVHAVCRDGLGWSVCSRIPKAKHAVGRGRAIGGMGAYQPVIHTTTRRATACTCLRAASATRARGARARSMAGASTRSRRVSTAGVRITGQRAAGSPGRSSVRRPAVWRMREHFAPVPGAHKLKRAADAAATLLPASPPRCRPALGGPVGGRQARVGASADDERRRRARGERRRCGRDCGAGPGRKPGARAGGLQRGAGGAAAGRGLQA